LKEKPDNLCLVIASEPDKIPINFTILFAGLDVDSCEIFEKKSEIINPTITLHNPHEV